ncbi:MAG: hypothetical protein HZA51_10235 [Planctomycetes bacterium]|nr:hypothetical protein [Planctomycetota bacterium]
MTDQPIAPPKRRNWFARHPKTSIFLAFILLIAIGLFAFDTIAKRRLAARIDAIRAKGEPTCVDDLKKLKRPGPNSLPEVLALAEKTAKVPLGDKTDKLHIVGTAMRQKTGCRMPQDEIDTMRWFLDQVKSERTAMHEAMHRSRGTLDIPWGTSRDNMRIQVLDAMSAYRALMKLHLLEALYATEISNAKEAGDLLIDYRYVLEAPGDDATLLVMLIQFAGQSMYLDQIERTINRSGLLPSDLMSLQTVVASLDNMQAFSKMLCAERVYFLDNLDPFYRDTIGVSLFIGAPGILALDAGVGLDSYAKYAEACDTKGPGLARRFRSIQAGHANLPWYSVISKMVLAPLDGAANLWLRKIGTQRAMLVALAAERYRLDNNRWPTTPNELVPKYLAAIPLDPIDDQPIRYAIIPEGIKVWTISGDDADQDNGGDIRRLEPSETGKRPTDFGWLLLNPDLRGRECSPPTPTTAPTTTTQRKP